MPGLTGLTGLLRPSIFQASWITFYLLLYNVRSFYWQCYHLAAYLDGLSIRRNTLLFFSFIGNTLSIHIHLLNYLLSHLCFSNTYCNGKLYIGLYYTTELYKQNILLNVHFVP